MTLLDNGTVAEENVRTSALYHDDIGRPKAAAVAETLWRQFRFEAQAVEMDVTDVNFRGDHDLPPVGADIIVDCLDNYDARAATCGLRIPTLHIGANADIGTAVWDRNYVLVRPNERERVCTHDLFQPLLETTALAGFVSIVRFIRDGEQISMFVNNELEVIRA